MSSPTDTNWHKVITYDHTLQFTASFRLRGTVTFLQTPKSTFMREYILRFDQAVHSTVCGYIAKEKYPAKFRIFLFVHTVLLNYRILHANHPVVCSPPRQFPAKLIHRGFCRPYPDFPGSPGAADISFRKCHTFCNPQRFYPRGLSNCASYFWHDLSNRTHCSMYTSQRCGEC